MEHPKQKTTIDNLKSLGAALEQKRETELKERFEKELAGKFDRVPNGNFQTKLTGVESMSIVRREDNRGLSLVLYRDEGKKHETFSLFGDGTVSGRIPAGLTITHRDILEETLRILDMVEVGAWHHVPDSLLPEGPWFPEEETKKHGGEGKKGTDPERVHFLTSQPDFLFGFNGGNSGFRGYYGYVFPWGIVLEKGAWQNAAYFIDFPEPLSSEITTQVKTPPSHTQIPKDEFIKLQKGRDDILKQHWTPVADQKKWNARHLLNLDFFIHRGAHRDEEWQTKMTERLDAKRGKS